RDDVQVASICADPQRRAPLIIAAAQAGKHLYLDKPLCATLAEADEIAREVQAAGVLNQMFTQVHGSAAMRVRRLIESNRLGEVVGLHCDLFFAKGHAGTATLGAPRRETPQPRMFEVTDAKRELHNIGIYPLAMLRWLLKREAKRVFATTSNFFFREHQQRD